jgi:hypothetical protein
MDILSAIKREERKLEKQLATIQAKLKGIKTAARPAKRARSKVSSRKKKPVRSQSQTAGALAVEVAKVDIIGGIEQDSVEETEAAVIDPQDEHYPPGH